MTAMVGVSVGKDPVIDTVGVAISMTAMVGVSVAVGTTFPFTATVNEWTYG